MKKNLLFSILSLLVILPVAGQNLKDYHNSLRFEDIKGKEITFIKVFEEADMFYGEQPDTIWVKKVKKPKLNKHYTLVYPYKAVKSEAFNDYRTPRHVIEGRTFYVEQVLYCDKEVDVQKSYIDRYHIYSLKLKDINTGEILFFKIDKDDTYHVLTFKVRDMSVYNQLKDKMYVDYKTGKSMIINDCYYSYKSYGTSGWSLRYGDSVNLEIEFDDNTTITAKYAENYMTPEQYEKVKYEEKIKQLKEDANKGDYKMFASSLEKPSSNKFSKGKIHIDNILGILTYADNYISIEIIPEEECFRFVLNNVSSGTIKINWDDIIFIDEYNQSRRMIHSGVRYIDANKPQNPTLIARNSSINDILVPIHRLYYSSYDYEWSVLAILNYVHVYNHYKEGTQVKLILPIEVGNNRYEYTITYDVVWQWRYPEIRRQWLELESSTLD